YRLDIDTGPRVAFSVPAVVERGKSTRAKLFGWNLSARGTPASIHAEPTALGSSNPPASAAGPRNEPPGLERIEVEIPAEMAAAGGLERVRRYAAQAPINGFAYEFPGGHSPIAIGATDVPVVLEEADNHAPETAQAVACPCEVSGEIAGTDECDWFALD